MHRTDGLNHVANQFSDGVPPTPGTQVEQAWLNAVQEEIANAVEGAGITLVKGTWDQLKKAIGLGGGSGGARAFSASLASEFWSIINTGAGIALKLAGSGTTAAAAVLDLLNNSTGLALNAVTGGATAAKFATSTDTNADAAIDLVKGSLKFSGANPASADALTNQLTPLNTVKGFAHYAWNNAAPTLTSGCNMAAPGNPAAGQIQVNLNGTALTDAMIVVGMAGAGAWHPVAKNTTGLIEVQDNAGAAVNFGATTGFLFVIVMGKQVNAG